VTVIDVHAHALLPAVDAVVSDAPGLIAHQQLEARRAGAASGPVSRQMVRDRWRRLTELDVRLADMAAAGIDAQVVSPSPSHYHYWAPLPLADKVARCANEQIAALVARARDRLTGLGLVPLQYPERCVAALEHAVVDCGLAGVEISSYAQGPRGHTVELSDPRLEPFWTRAEELGAVVFLHPFGCTLDERLDRFYLSNTVAQPVENAVALSHLIFSGTLDRHPRLRLVAAHGGGYLPTYLGRSDHAWQVRPDAHGCAEPPGHYLRRLWFDSLVYTPWALRALVDAAGADRVLLGSDYPFDMGVEDPLHRLHQAGLAHRDTLAIAGGNAGQLGLLPPAAR
jgi:aminocarboxymuconate-semialdehyde decarboxylase